MLIDKLKNEIYSAFAGCGFEESFVKGPDDVLIETPRDRGHGDYATNLPMTLAKPLKMNPREIAEKIAAGIKPGGLVASAEIAGPGFLNFRVSPSALRDILPEAMEAGEKWGANESLKGRKIQVEFVSANPTGPLSVGHGRLAVFGDALARILAACGCEVFKEYYVNDVGNQVKNLADSVNIRYRELHGKSGQGECGYQGEYIKDYACEIKDKYGDSLLDKDEEECRRLMGGYTVGRILDQQAESLKLFDIEFDRWFRESELYDADLVNQTLEILKEKGHIYEQEGALWFASTKFTDTQDRVLKKSGGMPTYFLSDIAYHRNKFERGFDTVIDIWGADHHGYIPRMKSAMAALDLDPEKLEILIVQLVRFKRSGDLVRMSKRAGNIIELSDLIEEVGADVTRFFFLMRTKESHLDFDLELAKDKSEANPMYYLQYAYARICSILRKAGEQGMEPSGGESLSMLEAPQELLLMKRVADFPWEVQTAGASREPHRIITFLTELAGDFHAFYHEHRVISEEEPELSGARLDLCNAVKNVFLAGLSLIGVSAPESM